MVRLTQVSTMRFSNSMTIAASPERMWQLTLDVVRWPEWTPTMTRIELLEPLAPGSRVRIKQPGQPSLIWTVTTLETLSLFQWQTRLPWGTTMTGTHRILPIAGKCINHLELELSGPGSWILGVLGAPMFGLALWLENRGFRGAAESAVHLPA